MAYDEIADAEPLGDDEYDEDEQEEDDDDEDEQEYLFGTIPRTPGLIALAAVVVVILLLLAALFSANFGFVGGISGMEVTIPGQEGELLDEKLDIRATTKTPTFGKNADGKADLKIYYDGDTEVYTGNLKFNDGLGERTIPYEDFYVDNGEYTVEVTYEGVTESDSIELKRTAHYMIVLQKDYEVFESEDSTIDKVRYQISLFPDEDSTGNHDVLWTPGEGHIQVWYVDDENDKTDNNSWEKVMEIQIATDFRNFEYQFPNEDVQNRSSVEKFVIDFEAQTLLDEKGDGYYSMEVFFENTYGLESKGAFRDEVTAMPEENPDESYTWIHLEDD